MKAGEEFAKKISKKFKKEWSKNNYSFSDGHIIEIWIKHAIEDEYPYPQADAQERYDKAVKYIDELSWRTHEARFIKEGLKIASGLKQ